MNTPSQPDSPRRVELLERAYQHVLTHGLADMSLRPLAHAIGSSPRVLLFLFESKEGLVRALLARARLDELSVLESVPLDDGTIDQTALLLWDWLAAPGHRNVLTLWAESYTRSLVQPDGAWAGFAEQTVNDWLTLLAAFQPEAHRDSDAAVAERTIVLAILRGALLDLLATGDAGRTTAAVRQQLMAGRAGRTG